MGGRGFSPEAAASVVGGFEGLRDPGRAGHSGHSLASGHTRVCSRVKSASPRSLCCIEARGAPISRTFGTPGAPSPELRYQEMLAKQTRPKPRFLLCHRRAGRCQPSEGAGQSPAEIAALITGRVGAPPSPEATAEISSPHYRAGSV